MSSITYDGQMIIKANSRSRLTPNFRASEYYGKDDSIYIHRDLVAGVQVLRDLVGPLSIASVKPRSIAKGHGVTVKATDKAALLKAAKALKAQGHFFAVEQLGSSIVLLTVSPTARPIKPVFAFDTGLQVVANYETTADPYSQVTGNFDGAGISFGIIQFNFLSGTLQELFRLFRSADSAALQNCFRRESSYAELWRAVDGSVPKAVHWGNSISIGASKHKVAKAWTSDLTRVGRIEHFRLIQMEFAYDKYGRQLMSTIAYLQGLTGLKIRNHRCLTALFDMCIQQGGYHKAAREIAQRVKREAPADELALTHIAVEERAKKARKQYQADCLSRRLGILYREPRKITLNHVTSRRVNKKIYLVKNNRVSGVEKYLSPAILRDVG
jgi:hypothetical protein